MTSERQKAANRANALRSTGPKTPEGKGAVHLNALRHGLLARDVVLPEEDADAFKDLFNQVRAHLTPVGPIEEFLADRAIQSMWKLQRAARAEIALLHSRIDGLKADSVAPQVGYQEFTDLIESFTKDAAHEEVSKALARARCQWDRDEVFLGRAFEADKSGDAFANLARYERSAERSFYRSFNELRRLQDERQNRPSSPILDAIEVNTEDTE